MVFWAKGTGMQRQADMKSHSIFSEPKIDTICVIEFSLNYVLSAHAFALWGLDFHEKLCAEFLSITSAGK